MVIYARGPRCEPGLDVTFMSVDVSCDTPLTGENMTGWSCTPSF